MRRGAILAHLHDLASPRAHAGPAQEGGLDLSLGRQREVLEHARGAPLTHRHGQPSPERDAVRPERRDARNRA